MESSILIAIISAAASVSGAVLSFFFATRKEKESDWRKIKFDHYKEFMSALSGIVGSDAVPETQKRFVQASNTVQLVASKEVIEALHGYRDEIAVSNSRQSNDKHDFLLSALIHHIRADLGVRESENPPGLSVRLFSSGVNEKPKA
jgi:hypothetical protein